MPCACCGGVRRSRSSPSSTLTLAIGANTAIFSVANAILFAPPPYGDPGRLIALAENNIPDGNPRSDMSAADLVDYRAAQHTLTGIGILANGGVTLRDGTNDPLAVRALYGSANLFGVLETRPLVGRTFAPDEDGATHARVTILSYDIWQENFHGSPSVVGRTVTLDGEAYQVIGVMPRGFALGYREQIYVPLDMTPRLSDPNRARKLHWLFAIARLKPGVGIAAARADLNGIAHALEARYPDANTGHYVSASPSRQRSPRGDRYDTAVAWGCGPGPARGLCQSRQHDAGTRRREEPGNDRPGGHRRGPSAPRRSIARGESRPRHLWRRGRRRAGIVMVRVVVRSYPAALPLLAMPTLDWRVLSFSIVVSIATGLLVGILPALRVSPGRRSGDIEDIDPYHSGRSQAGVAPRRARRVADVYGSRVAGHGRVARAESRRARASRTRVRAGARTRGQSRRERATISVGRVIQRLLRRCVCQNSDVPGVDAVGAASSLPPLGSSSCGLTIEGRSDQPDHPLSVLCLGARGAYFEAMGTPILSGRTFDQTDRPGGPRVVMINAAMAKQFFPGGSPLGNASDSGPIRRCPGSGSSASSATCGRATSRATQCRPLSRTMHKSPWGSLTIVVPRRR